MSISDKTLRKQTTEVFDPYDDRTGFRIEWESLWADADAEEGHCCKFVIRSLSELSDHDIYGEGSIAWNGCSDLYFANTNNYVHLCGSRAFRLHLMLMQRLFYGALEQMGREPDTSWSVSRDHNQLSAKEFAAVLDMIHTPKPAPEWVRKAVSGDKEQDS